MWKLTTLALSIHEPGEHFSLTLPKALEPCSGVHWGRSGTVIQPWAMGTANNTEWHQHCARRGILGGLHTESWEEEHPARDHVCVPEVGYKFSCTYPSDQVSPFSRHAEWQNKLTQKHFMGLCFSSQLHQAGNVHRPSGHCCPQVLRLLQLFISFLHSSNQFPFSTLWLPEIWPQRPSYPSPSLSGYTKTGFKNQGSKCSKYRLTNPHYLTQVKAGLRQGRLTWSLK